LTRRQEKHPKIWKSLKHEVPRRQETGMNDSNSRCDADDDTPADRW